MNDIDIRNIEKEIQARKSQIFKFEEGGDMTLVAIERCTTNELEEIVEKYNYEKKCNFFNIFKSAVDNFFSDFSDEDENQNIIIISACNYEDRDVFVIDQADIFTTIDFNKHEYNDKVYVVGSKRNYYNNLEDFNFWMRKFYTGLLHHGYIKPIENYYKDNEEVNLFWYGCYGITRDYKIVSFIIRYDGWIDKDPIVIFEF